MTSGTSPGLEKINEAAVRVIGLKGFARATTQAIAREAGVSEGLIYRYYKTKLDLGLALFSTHYGEILRQLRALATRHEQPLERLRAVAMAFYQWFDENQEVAQFLVRTHHDFLELTEWNESVTELVSASLKELLGEPLYSLFPSDILSAMVTGAAVQVVIESTHGQVRGPLAPRMESIVEALVSMIGRSDGLARRAMGRDVKPEPSQDAPDATPGEP